MFEYTKIESGDDFVVSPSSIATFMDNPRMWFKSHISKESVFRGNTSSCLGTVVHAMIEAHYSGNDVSKEDVKAYYDSLKDNMDVDVWAIDAEYKLMFDAWKQTYCPPEFEPKLIEAQIKFNPTAGFCVGGSIDALFGDTIVDWKTTGASKTEIGDYKYQLLVYAWILRKTGVEVNNIQICYIKRPKVNRGLGAVTKAYPLGKPLEDIPAKVTIANHKITDQDMEDTEALLRTIVKTVKAYNADNSLLDILFRENPLSFRQ